MLLDVDGHPTFCHTGGAPLPDGSPDRPVVLLHGAGNDHSVWRYQTRRLARAGIPAVAPDLPGHGRSAGQPCTSVPAWAEWVLRLLDALGAADAILVGHSMGSLMALHAAALAPARVAGLALLATSTHMGVHPELQAAADAGDDLAIDLIVGWSHTGRSRFGGHRQAGVWNAAGTRRLLEANLSTLGTDLRAVSTYDAIEAATTIAGLPSGAQPSSLVVAGEADRMTPARAGGELAAGLGIRAHVIPDAGHVFPYDQPVELNALLLPFVDEVRRAAAPA